MIDNAATPDRRPVLLLSHCFAPNTGGVETHLDDLVTAAAARGVALEVLTYQPLVTRARAARVEQRGSVTIRRLAWPGFGLFNRLEPYPLLQFLYLFPGLFTVATLRLLLRPRRYRAIHAHGMVCAVIGRLLKAVFGPRLVVGTHAVYGWLYNLSGNGLLPRFLRWVLGGADTIQTLAEASRQELLKLGIPADRLARFTYWVDQAHFNVRDRATARRALGWPETSGPETGLTALFVGRLIPAKGIRLLIALAESFPAIRFALAGDGPLRGELDAAARRLPNLTPLGRVANRDLPPLYNAADVLLVPSQYEEGFGRIILEALSCGCPVIASRRGGIPEAMDESVGQLVTDDHAGFAAALNEFMAAPARLAALRSPARRYAEARYSAANADTIFAAY